MVTKVNTAMSALLEDIDEAMLPTLPLGLRSLLQQGLTVKDDSVVMTAALANRHPPRDAFPDLTGYEAFLNHVHIEVHLDETENKSGILQYGLAFVHGLASIVVEAGLSPQQIVLSIGGTDCSVRFYTRRAGEEYLAEDLEAFKDEALLVVDV